MSSGLDRHICHKNELHSQLIQDPYHVDHKSWLRSQEHPAPTRQKRWSCYWALSWSLSWSCEICRCADNNSTSGSIKTRTALWLPRFCIIVNTSSAVPSYKVHSSPRLGGSWHSCEGFPQSRGTDMHFSLPSQACEGSEAIPAHLPLGKLACLQLWIDIC